MSLAYLSRGVYEWIRHSGLFLSKTDIISTEKKWFSCTAWKNNPEICIPMSKNIWVQKMSTGVIKCHKKKKKIIETVLFRDSSQFYPISKIIFKMDIFIFLFPMHGCIFSKRKYSQSGKRISSDAKMQKNLVISIPLSGRLILVSFHINGSVRLFVCANIYIKCV